MARMTAPVTRRHVAALPLLAWTDGTYGPPLAAGALPLLFTSHASPPPPASPFAVSPLTVACSSRLRSRRPLSSAVWRRRRKSRRCRPPPPTPLAAVHPMKPEVAEGPRAGHRMSLGGSPFRVGGPDSDSVAGAATTATVAGLSACPAHPTFLLNGLFWDSIPILQTRKVSSCAYFSCPAGFWGVEVPC